jgi:hypothetical protein
MKSHKILVLCCLLFFPVLANAEEPRLAESGGLPAFLASLSAAPGACAAQQSNAVGVPDPSLTGHGNGCHAELNCFARCTLNCEGTTSCTVGNGSITCDNYTLYCPPTCSAPLYCADVCGKCECQAQGGSSTYCAYVHC